MDRIEEVRQQNKARAKKHYEAHKAEILLKKKEAYDAKAEAEPEPVAEPVPVKKNKKKIQLAGVFIEELHKQNKKKYIDDVKRLVLILGNDNLYVLNKTRDSIMKIRGAVKDDGEKFSVNTTKATYQAILFMIDSLGLDVKKQPYHDQFQIYKMLSIGENQEKQTEQVPYFLEYMMKVEDTFGVDSKMYLIASLYDAFTIRDNYQLRIVDEPDNETDNFLVLTPKMRIIINTYKTDGYGQLVFRPKKKLVKLIEAYMKRTETKVGDYLLGSKPLSSYITKHNEKMGYKGSINLYRHMKITEQIRDATPEERLRLSKIMGHSPATQLKYVKGL